MSKTNSLDSSISSAFIVYLNPSRRVRALKERISLRLNKAVNRARGCTALHEKGDQPYWMKRRKALTFSGVIDT